MGQRSFTQAPSCSPNLIGICAPAAPPIMLRIGTHSLNPIPNPNPTQEHTVTLGLQLSVLQFTVWVGGGCVCGSH